MLPTVFLALAVAAPALKDKPKPAPPSIVGTWVVETMVVGGQPRVLGADREHWVFNADGSRTAGPGDTVQRRGTFVLDLKANPPALDLTADPGNVRHLCIYRIDGDTLTINVGWQESERPAAFESPAGSRCTLRTFKRVRPDGGKP
jgi:uncharacterized protein (TIGR03067 family)